jgi:hypothetical protein
MVLLSSSCCLVSCVVHLSCCLALYCIVLFLVISYVYLLCSQGLCDVRFPALPSKFLAFYCICCWIFIFLRSTLYFLVPGVVRFLVSCYCQFPAVARFLVLPFPAVVRFLVLSGYLCCPVPCVVRFIVLSGSLCCPVPCVVRFLVSPGSFYCLAPLLSGSLCCPVPFIV